VSGEYPGGAGSAERARVGEVGGGAGECGIGSYAGDVGTGAADCGGVEECRDVRGAGGRDGLCGCESDAGVGRSPVASRQSPVAGENSVPLLRSGLAENGRRLSVYGLGFGIATSALLRMDFAIGSFQLLRS